MSVKSWLLLPIFLSLAVAAGAQGLGDLGEAPPPTAPVKTLEGATVVIFNSNDPESADLARFYAGKRNIPKEQVVGLKCPTKEEITREEYDTTIAEPLREIFAKKGWWDMRPVDHPLGRIEKSRIRFVALMRGMPLKIAVTVNYPGDDFVGLAQVAAHNEASVDSELAALGAFSRVISGVHNNPYYRSFTRILDTTFPDLLLVCRLDASSGEIVKRMITDALAAEQEGLRGFAYVDARNVQTAGLAEGDKWLYTAARDARRCGMPVILDNGEGLFPEGYPMRQAALYLGWYSENVVGPFVRPDFRFNRGAVAVHIHSFSAATLRDPRRGWCAPLLAAGAAATLGNVYEPFLGLTPQLDLFADRLESGFTFAESAWAAERVTSWQTTFLGDPLYRPFKYLTDLSAKAGTSEWDVCRAGTKMWFEAAGKGEEVLAASATKMKSGLLWEALGLLQLTTGEEQKEALASFNSARAAYASSDDILRVAIHELILLRAMKREGELQALAQRMLSAYPKARATEVVRMLAPAPATPVPK